MATPTTNLLKNVLNTLYFGEKTLITQAFFVNYYRQRIKISALHEKAIHYSFSVINGLFNLVFLFYSYSPDGTV